MPRKKSWGLRRVEVEVGGIVGKVKLVFGKKEIPRKSSPKQRKRARKVVRQELKKVESQTDPPVVLDTIIKIANRERRKAMREGEYVNALAASWVEQVGLEEKRKFKSSASS